MVARFLTWREESYKYIKAIAGERKTYRVALQLKVQVYDLLPNVSKNNVSVCVQKEMKEERMKKNCKVKHKQLVKNMQEILDLALIS